MRRDSGTRGYAGRASGGLRGNGTHGSFDEECYAVDLRCAKATDTLIDDLPSPQKVAVYHFNLGGLTHGLLDIEGAYADACDKLQRELTRRGID